MEVYVRVRTLCVHVCAWGTCVCDVCVVCGVCIVCCVSVCLCCCAVCVFVCVCVCVCGVCIWRVCGVRCGVGGRAWVICACCGVCVWCCVCEWRVCECACTRVCVRATVQHDKGMPSGALERLRVVGPSW
jgi:hypothetical protein